MCHSNKCFLYLWVQNHSIKQCMDLNIIFWSLNRLEHVHLLIIELEHPHFGFKRTYIEHITPLTRYAELFIKHTRTSIFRTWIIIKHVHRTWRAQKFVFQRMVSLKYCSMNFCYLMTDKSTDMFRTCNTVFLVSLVKKCPSKAFLQLWLHTDIFLCSKEHSRGFQIDLHFDKTHSDNALVVSKLRNLICTCLHNYHCICRQTICWLLTILQAETCKISHW